WNFGFIGATAMLTETYTPAEKNKVQGLHDFLLFGTVAFASLMSGQVYNASGWAMLNWIVFPVVFVCLTALGALAVTGRRRRPASPEWAHGALRDRPFQPGDAAVGEVQPVVGDGARRQGQCRVARRQAVELRHLVHRDQVQDVEA